MGVEIERKFLVAGDSWRGGVRQALRIAQGYLTLDPERCVRVRLANGRAWLTVKGRLQGLRRAEFEFPIPPDEASALLALCLPSPVEKTRHQVPFGGHLWEIDVFHGPNDGLILAEIELTDEAEPFTPPPWLGREVSADPRFLNANLATRPFASFRNELARLDDPAR